MAIADVAGKDAVGTVRGGHFDSQVKVLLVERLTQWERLIGSELGPA